MKVIQEIQIDKDKVILDSEIIYSGKENPSAEEKLVRKAIGLPITKQLIYYVDKRDSKSAVNVMQYQLVEMYNITERWYTIEITAETGIVIRIHSLHLIEMQKPSFVTDMAKQEA